MKIVLCGPPHSGKTVFANSLYLSLPQSYTSIIRGCPDGESVFSSNYDQHNIAIVRRKGDFTPEFIDTVCESIKKEVAPIVLIDVGGKRTAENEQIFREADACIIISSDEKETEEWKKFAENLSVEPIAILDSKLHGEDKLLQTHPYITGIITGLERGAYKEKSELFMELVTDIQRKSLTQGLKKKGEELLKESDSIDLTIIARELHMINEDGNISWDEERLSDIYDMIDGALDNRPSVNFFESRPPWLTALTTELAKNKGIEDIEYYDARNNAYIKTKKMETSSIEPDAKLDENTTVYELIPNGGLRLIRSESENQVLMHFEVSPNRLMEYEDMEKIELPEIDSSKKMYIDGRLPNWFVSSLVNSYDNKDKSMLRAGIGFRTISSSDHKTLGLLEKSPAEINFDEVVKMYLEYAQKEKEKLDVGGDDR